MTLSTLQLRASLRYFMAHPAQLGLALLGLALGVAAVVSVGAARATISESFARFSGQLGSNASHQIVATERYFSAREYVTLRRRFGQIPMAPVLTFDTRDSNGQAYSVMGVDLLREAGLGRFTGPYLTDNTFPLGDWLSGEPLTMTTATDAGTVALGDGAAALEVVGQLDPALASGTRHLLVLDMSLATRLFVATRVAMTAADPSHQDVPELPLSRIDLVLDRQHQVTLEQLQKTLPPGLRLKTVAQNNTAGMSRAFELNLLALSLLALLVGAFIVFNTLRFFVLQRQQVFGFCRMLGLTARDVVGWILLEAALLGVVGTLLGMVLGLWMADLVMSNMARTVGQLYYESVTANSRIAPTVWLQAGVLGLAGSLAAALWPALSAARVSPLRQVQVADQSLTSRWLFLPGLGCLMLALLIQLQPGLISALAGVFLVAVGWIALSVPLSVQLASRLPLPVARLPLLGFARSRLPQTLSRTGAALAALILAVATVIGVDHMILSFRSSVVGWLDASLSADAYVRNGPDNAAIDPGAVTLVLASAGVETVTQSISRYWPDSEGVQRLSAQRLEGAGARTYQMMTPWQADDWDQWAQEPVALISEPLARRLNVGPGQVVQVPGPDGPVAITVGAIFQDYRADGGRVVLHLDQYRALWRDPAITGIGIYFKPGQKQTGFDTLRQDLAQTAGAGDLQLVETGVIRRQSLAIFDQTFELTRGLKWLAAIVAFVGVLSAILALQLERRRESELLNAMGLSRPQISTLLLLESAGLGLAAALLAMPLGAALAWLLTRVVNARAFGWTLYVEWQPATFMLGIGLALAAALLAALAPALSFNRRSAKAQLA